MQAKEHMDHKCKLRSKVVFSQKKRSKVVRSFSGPGASKSYMLWATLYGHLKYGQVCKYRRKVDIDCKQTEGTIHE
jgi:hypothetical protein